MKMIDLGAAILFVLMAGLPIFTQAAPREANKNDAALMKLQSQLKAITAERDAAKGELDKLSAENERLKQEKAAALSGQAALNGELSAQKNAQLEARNRLEKSNAMLLEVMDKHKQTSQAKLELSNELEQLKQKQQAGLQQLSVCEEHNVKLYQSGKELLERYQGKGVLTSLLQDEPLLQFQSVEMESIVQDYQDKLNSGQYKLEVTGDSIGGNP